MGAPSPSNSPSALSAQALWARGLWAKVCRNREWHNNNGYEENIALFTRDIGQMLSSQICTIWSHVSPRSAAVLLTLNSPFLFFCAQYYHITEPCLLIGYKYAKTTYTFESNLPFHVQMSVILFTVHQLPKNLDHLLNRKPQRTAIIQPGHRTCSGFKIVLCSFYLGLWVSHKMNLT